MLIGMGRSGRLWQESSSESRPAEEGSRQKANIRDLGQMNQCLYCLTQALKIDPSDVDALWEVANIHRAQDNKLKVNSRRPIRIGGD
jgi:hypothetical protein